ncbi:hypothetical protein EIP91_011036 [Steccherinum ochraceum]|uniref:Uncharacterized protein n=1 Tax=Steccherinum ochraceum TaxID=92696 RepID=A0A4R0R8E2_9APHY|nr:hypothetical protein EIP91_011036 [Steccherinum ochraceum]
MLSPFTQRTLQPKARLLHHRTAYGLIWISMRPDVTWTDFGGSDGVRRESESPPPLAPSTYQPPHTPLSSDIFLRHFALYSVHRLRSRRPWPSRVALSVSNYARHCDADVADVADVCSSLQDFGRSHLVSSEHRGLSYLSREEMTHTRVFDFPWTHPSQDFPA